ncbi:MAG: metalloregulator ArsR/SmtB family transcription factor [Cyanobacteria bacterium]|nr:metalloregulator ArsR/SmtB family transcription factor [Cyanobacteriota bacterium]
MLLYKSELCVCEIQEIIGLSQPTISFDLKKLEEAEIITYSKSGLWVNYAINENCFFQPKSTPLNLKK